jgi:hypothetical protein
MILIKESGIICRKILYIAGDRRTNVYVAKEE